MQKCVGCRENRSGCPENRSGCRIRPVRQAAGPDAADARRQSFMVVTSDVADRRAQDPAPTPRPAATSDQRHAAAPPTAPPGVPGAPHAGDSSGRCEAPQLARATAGRKPKEPKSRSNQGEFARWRAAARRQAPAAQQSILAPYGTAMPEAPKEPKSRRNPGESAMVPGRTNPPDRSGEGVRTRPSMQEQARRLTNPAGRWPSPSGIRWAYQERSSATSSGGGS
jgi:hypothetical protein